MKDRLWPRADNHKLPPSRLASRVSRYLTLLQRVQIRDGRRVLFVWPRTRIWWVIFQFPRSSSGPLLLRLLFRTWQFAIIVFAWKSGPVAFHQSPSNVMPHLMAVSSLPSSSSTTCTWLVPRYAAYFQFPTEGNAQYAILNIHSATVIYQVKKGSKKEMKMERRAHQKTTTGSLNQGSVSCDK
jgi:hypothetical protein